MTNTSVGKNVNAINSSNKAFTQVALNTTTATTILAANQNRLRTVIKHSDDNSVWIREYPASTDNTKQEFDLDKGGLYETDDENPYVDEISGITVAGNVTVDVWEYTKN